MQITKRDVRGVESSGMLCSAYDLGWVKQPDEVLVEMPLDFMPGDPCPPDMPEGVCPAQAQLSSCMRLNLRLASLRLGRQLIPCLIWGPAAG